MASPAGVGAAVAGAAVVTLLSAALAFYGPPLDAGTRPRAARPDGGAGGAGPREQAGARGLCAARASRGRGRAARARAFRPAVARVTVPEFGLL